MDAAKKSVKGTQTEKNLTQAYLSECQANARYIFYAKQAHKENYFPIEQILTVAADNELHHAKVFFKFLEGGKCLATLDADAGVIADTATNLRIAISEEENEGVRFYQAAAKTAREEGFDVIASHFEHIARVEMEHRDRFTRYLDMLEKGTIWKRDTPIRWVCLVCGYVFEGTEPPQTCPACDHPYQHYMPIEDYI